MILLDCTLRDGGYYNNWDFDSSLVSSYFRAIDLAKVDAVEIGFRLPPKNKFIGAFGYCTEAFLSQLNLPSCKIGVMVNAKEATSEFLNSSFVPASDSCVDFVRVATHFNTLQESVEALQFFKNMGYETCLNLMQISTKTPEEIAKAVQCVVDSGAMDVLYFADSFGGLCEEDVRRIIRAFQQHWDGAIGVHGHDNRGAALQNTLCALDEGAEWVDSTMLGMGRGAGNTKTEELLIELQEREHDYDYGSVLPLVLDWFQPLKEKYHWGANILYYLSAMHDIHPTYIQKILETNHGTSQVLSAISSLKSYSSFNESALSKAILGEESVRGSWSAENWVQDKDVLLLAGGNSCVKYKKEIQQFIDRNDLFVVSLNANPSISQEYIESYAVCHYSRILTELEACARSSLSSILIPFQALNDSLQHVISDMEIFDYGIQVEPGKFEIYNNYCVVPALLVAPYALAAISAGNPRRILLAGFDGYPEDISRQQQIVEIFQQFQSISDLPLVSLTPTPYPVVHSSLFSSEYCK